MLKARLTSLRMRRFMDLGFTQSILIATILMLIFGHSNGRSKINFKKTMTNWLEKSTDHKIN